MKKLQIIASFAAAGALLAVPAVGQANHGVPHGKSQGAPHGKAKGKNKAGSKCVVNKGFTVRGTLVSYTADNAGTQNVNEESVTLTVTGQNRHAQRAGLTDVSPGTPGLQYRLNDADDSFTLQLSEFGPGQAPAAGDAVRIVGKVAVTKKKCAPAGASLEDRYGAVNVRKVKIVDAD